MFSQLSSSLYPLHPVTPTNIALIKTLERSSTPTHAKPIDLPQRVSEHLIQWDEYSISSEIYLYFIINRVILELPLLDFFLYSLRIRVKMQKCLFHCFYLFIYSKLYRILLSKKHSKLAHRTATRLLTNQVFKRTFKIKE